MPACTGCCVGWSFKHDALGTETWAEGTGRSRCGGLCVVFNTQERRPGRVAPLWAVVCGKVKNQASLLERKSNAVQY